MEWSQLFFLAQRAEAGLNDPNYTRIAIIAGIVVLGLIFIGLCIAFITYGKLWFQAYMSGADVKMSSLIAMGFRKVRPDVIVKAKVMARQAGLDINRKTGIGTEQLEAHYLAGGDIMRVTNSIIAAQRANIDLDLSLIHI